METLTVQTLCGALAGVLVSLVFGSLGDAPLLATASSQQLQALDAMFMNLTTRAEILERIGTLRSGTSDNGKSEMGTSARAADVDLGALCTLQAGEVADSDDVLKVSSAVKGGTEQRAEHTRKRSDERILALETPPEKALESDRRAARVFRELAKEQLEQTLAADIEDQTIFLFGISKEVIAYAEKARRVITIEKEPELCDKFLASGVGVCSLKENVHLFCMKENHEEERDRLMAVYSKAEKLIQDQYNDIPLDVVQSDMRYPVALALKLFEEIDQSTTLVLRHRLSHAALEALGKYFRQILLVLPDPLDPDMTSSTAYVLLRKRYVPNPPPDLWESYVSPEWRLDPNEEPLIRFKRLVEEVSERFKDELNELENTRVGIQARTIRSHYHLATDTARKGDVEFIDELQTLMSDPKTTLHSVQALFKRRSQEVADLERNASVLKEYFDLLDKAIAGMPEEPMKHFLGDMQNDFIVATGRIDTTDSQLELLEDVLELLNPKLFSSTQLLPQSLHALRVAVASLNDVTDASVLVADIEKSVFRDVDPATIIKA
ncbi:hypothetical protein BESB_000560 [Besnoitia besnoiti]|uniref:Uncharacterized protein n=1 Tax=Besnoitia besnoiti TaxID=94643 RepID=A0A2A9MKH4_BESBE|nr:hypothetical protein BESB_000560 [Besnoitia besnoiti]PFH37714.1 hypothetical protein BESB_000560 [Besnoitia besnoiti]